MRWMAYHLMRVVNSLSFQQKLLNETQFGNEASKFLYMLALAALVTLASETQPTPVSNSRSAWRLGCETTLLIPSLLSMFECILLKIVCVCLASLYSFRAVRAACKPFSQLPSQSASFETVQPGF